MLAVLMVTRSSVVGDAAGLLLALIALVVLAAIGSPRSRVLAIGLLVAGLVAVGATQAWALPYPCPIVWKYLGIC